MVLHHAIIFSHVRTVLTKKANGRNLEEAIAVAVRHLLESGQLGINPGCGQVFAGKKYYSRARKDYITVDVALELTAPGALSPSLIWVWECKECSGAVRVGDVERLSSELDQIGADRTKGCMVTTGYYQRGAIEYAIARGISLMRWTEGAQIELQPSFGFYCPASMEESVASIVEGGAISQVLLAETSLGQSTQLPRAFFVNYDGVFCAADTLEHATSRLLSQTRETASPYLCDI